MGTAPCRLSLDDVSLDVVLGPNRSDFPHFVDWLAQARDYWRTQAQTMRIVGIFIDPEV